MTRGASVWRARLRRAAARRRRALQTKRDPLEGGRFVSERPVSPLTLEQEYWAWTEDGEAILQHKEAILDLMVNGAPALDLAIETAATSVDGCRVERRGDGVVVSRAGAVLAPFYERLAARLLDG